jgi:hypothetical protein
MNKQTGAQLILQERQEQIEKHGKSVDHDLKNYRKYELLDAGLACLGKAKWPKSFPETVVKKISAKPYRDRLAHAAAFFAAEIDRNDLEDAQSKPTVEALEAEKRKIEERIAELQKSGASTGSATAE